MLDSSLRSMGLLLLSGATAIGCSENASKDQGAGAFGGSANAGNGGAQVGGARSSGGTRAGGTTAAGAAPAGGTLGSGGAGATGGKAVGIGGGPSSGGSTSASSGGRSGGASSGGRSGGASSASGGASPAGGASGSSSGGRVSSGGSSASGARGGSVAAGGSTAAAVGGGFGNPAGKCALPAAAQPESVTSPTTVVGTGTPASCTSQAFIAAVAKGGVITFNCGPNPTTIVTTEVAKIYNQVGGANTERVVIDGGGLITLDGGGTHRILYQNTCDESLVWATSSCDSQSFPKLTVQNITFANGNGASSEVVNDGLMGGGALFVQGGTFKAYNVRVRASKETHPAAELAQDIAGGAIYLFMLTAPAYFVNSTFENNSASNGGAIGALFVSSYVLNCLFSANSATGHGMNPAASGTTGGGLGGAIYNDGNDYALTICGTAFNGNLANELGTGAIFQVVNNLNGDLVIDQSTFTGNSNTGSVQSHESIYVEARDKAGNAGVTITNTTFD